MSQNSPLTKEQKLNLLSLSRNETGFNALLEVVKAAEEEALTAFRESAEAAIFNEKVRTSAAMWKGKYDAFEQIYRVLTNLHLLKVEE